MNLRNGSWALLLSLTACPSAGSDTTCATDRALAGGVYDIAKSRFAFGSKPVAQRDADITRWTGSDGVVAIFSDGSELGILNGGAPEASLPDWSSNSETLAAHVTDYFVGMGVARCQIASSDILSGGSASGSVGGPPVSMSGPTSVDLARTIDGIPVVESHAFAQFDIHDQSISEGFYWPEIPVEVVQAAVSFRDRLTDPQALTAYKAKLPDNAQGDGQILIHHTSAGGALPLRAVTVYDVAPTAPDGGLLGRPSDLNFDADGNLVSDNW